MYIAIKEDCEGGNNMANVSADFVNDVVLKINAIKNKMIYKYIADLDMSIGALPTTADSLSLDAIRHLAVGAVIRGVVVSSTPSDVFTGSSDIAKLTKSLKQLHAKVDELTTVQTKMVEPEKSQAFLASKYEDLLAESETMKDMIKNFRAQQAQAKALPPPSTAEQDALVFSGIAESGTPAEVQQSVQAIFSDILEVRTCMHDITAVSMERLGSQPPSEGARPRKLLVKLQSKQQATTILKAAKGLKENIPRGRLPESCQSASIATSAVQSCSIAALCGLPSRLPNPQARCAAGKWAFACLSMVLRCCLAAAPDSTVVL